jgi:tRNA-splicing ligase RtcB
MRVPAVIYADENLIRDMDDKVFDQTRNVATLPGIVQASYAMPDAHWGYGFPIGGVAAFDPDHGGVISADGVGFDISCGVRTMLTGLSVADILPVQKSIAESLFRQIPAGVGSTGAITLDGHDMDAMLSGGARWAVERGWGDARDLAQIEENGTMARPRPEYVSDRAKERQCREMGTLGSGNHYLEVQAVAEVFDAAAAKAYELSQDDVVVTIHCGSRGLGHQIDPSF